MAVNILDKILAHKKTEISHAKAIVPLAELQSMMQEQKNPLSLNSALRNAPGIGIISEIKKASPSAGVIRPDFDLREIAKSYLAAGTNAISMITDERFFAGKIQFISAIRPFTSVPVLRKDFIIDPYQVAESRAYGADALLLIVAALELAKLKDLLDYTHELGMEALVETHDAEEVETALKSGAKIIGVNNRNLQSFSVDVGTTEALANLLPPNITLVAESGISTGADVRRMQAAGAKGILIGTHFMQQPDPGAALAALKGEIPL